MANHVFVNHCVDFAAILSPTNLVKGKTIDNMIKEAFKQSKTADAKMRVDFANYKDYGTDQWCPAYFGMFGEWFAWHFLNHYGSYFNVEGVEMTDSEGSSIEDYGVDGVGFTVRSQDLKSTGRGPEKGSPVKIQVKATMNKTKEYKANDGSRLPNFGLNALSESIVCGDAYKARYIVFTFGAGLHYSLDKMSNKLFEVIAYKKIKALADMDVVFLNRLRTSVNLPALPVAASVKDPEWIMIQNEI